MKPTQKQFTPNRGSVQKADSYQFNTDANEWFTPRRFAALLAVLIFAMFPDVVLGQRTFFFRDFQIFGYSWASFHRESFWRGEIPLWDPLSNCGIPFLAQWNTLTLYPLSLFYLLLPLSWSLGVFCLLHLFIAGLGMYFLAHCWTNHRLAAAFAGLVYAFNGLALNSLAWPNNIAALGWMPWLVLLAEKSWRGGLSEIVKAALIGAMQMLSGAPEIILLTWVFLGLLWLRELVIEKVHRRQIIFRFLLLATLVVGLAAVQLLPFMDLLNHSQRDRNFGAGLWPMPLWGVASLFVPMFCTFPWGQNVFFQYDQYWTTSYYTGIVTITLALLAIGHVRSRRVLLLATVSGVMLVLAMGEKALLYGWLQEAIPLFGFMRYPIKFVALIVFILPLMAACAIATLGSLEPTQTRRSLFISTLSTLGIIGIILCFARFRPIQEGTYNSWPATLQNGWTRGLLLAGFVAIFAILPQVTRTNLQILLRAVLLILVWLDMFSHTPRQNPTIPRWAYEPVSELRSWSSEPRLGESRAMPSAIAEFTLHNSALERPEEDALQKRLGLYFNCNLIDGIPKVNGVFSLHLREAEQFNKLLYSTSQLYEPLMDFLSVSQVTEPGKTMDWLARTNFMPLISAGQKPIFASESETLRELVGKGFDPRKTVFLPAETSDYETTNAAQIKIVPQRISAQEIIFEAEAAQKGWAVISQSYYHAWRAYVDESPVPLHRANHAFQAVEIPGGRHRIKLIYVNQWFRVGAIISLMTLAGCLAAWFRANRLSKNEK